MGNCVARDLGFETERLEKNNILMKKMQERINHKRTMDQPLGSHLDQSDEEDDDDSNSENGSVEEIPAQTEQNSKKTNSKSTINKSASQGNEQESLALSIMREMHPEIKNLENDLIGTLSDSMMGLTPIPKYENDDNDSDSNEEEKEIVISAKGMEYHSMKKKERRQEAIKASKSDNGFLKNIKEKNSVPEKKHKFQGTHLQVDRLNKFQDSKSCDTAQGKSSDIFEADIARDDGKRKSKCDKQQENFTERCAKVERSKELKDKSPQTNKSNRLNKSPQTNNLQNIFMQEGNEEREPQAFFDNRFYKDDIALKLVERTPSLPPTMQKIFPDGSETDNTDDD